MMPPTDLAPTFLVPVRQIVAIEHPMIVRNIDNGLKTLKSGLPLQELLNSNGHEGSFPIYLRPMDATCAPLSSVNTSSSNVLLKITVPKRTGRKRKRGSNEPYRLDPSILPQGDEREFSEGSHPTILRSHSRLDAPKDLLRTLRDNIGRYYIEPVGSIDRTHRYRGFADFHYSTSHETFMTKFQETILPGNVESLRRFKLDPSRGVKQNDEIVPPPTFSDKSISVNWGYHQNPNIKVTTDEITGATILTNQSRPLKINTFYVPYDTPNVPTSPPPLPPADPILQSLLTELSIALSERPIWTRRAIMNRIPRSNPGIYLLKPAIQYVAYQFRGGPWRDAIVRYGIDPRSSPEYRIYQTLFFKIVELPQPTASQGTANTATRLERTPWHEKRSEHTRKANPAALSPYSHVFDGTSVSLDGKVWQVCDITDPLLAHLLSTPVLRDTCDLHSDGWFCNGTWAKVRAIMRTKISAILIGREMLESDFHQTLLMPDFVEGKVRVTAHMPNLGSASNALADVEDGDGPAGDGASEGDDWVHGTTGLTRAPGTSTKSWRRRKIRGIKKRNRKRLDGTSNMGFGRARVLGISARKKGGVATGASGVGTEALGTSDSADGKNAALARPGISGTHEAPLGIEIVDGGVFEPLAQVRFLGSQDGAEGLDEGDEEGFEGEGVQDGDEEEGDEDDDDEEDGGDDDDEEEGDDDDDGDDSDDGDDDEELDGEGW